MGGHGDGCIPAIRFEGVTFGYGERPVLRDVSVAVCTGDFACVVGPNGGGKTTFLKLVLGLERPQRGSVTVLGTTPDEARSRMGYVPQQALYDPAFPVSVLDVVLMGLLGGKRWIGGYGREDRRAAREVLGLVGLEELEERAFHDLSGGQRQRVLIARALAARPELLLLDEATANLDVNAESDFFALLGKINERATIVVVSHDLGFVSQFVRSVICIRGTVALHPTAALTGATLSELYGDDARIIRHDHRCSEEGHTCKRS